MKPKLEHDAERIARDVLETFSAPYFALEPSQIERRNRVVRDAAANIQPHLARVRTDAVEDAMTGNA